MEQDTNNTEVIFRKFKTGEVIALFPYIIAGGHDGYSIESYMHVGQHGSADLGLTRTTKLATEDEYAPLKTELESIGYKLKLLKRYNHKKYLTAYFQSRKK